MTTTAHPRHARKEVRQLAEWLRRHGYELDSFDSERHATYRHPNGHHVTLPETPRGTTWYENIQKDARNALGIAANKRDPAAIRSRAKLDRQLRAAAAQRRRQRLAAELTRREHEQADRNRLIRDEDTFNRYAALMGGGGYRRSAVG